MILINGNVLLNHLRRRIMKSTISISFVSFSLLFSLSSPSMSYVSFDITVPIFAQDLPGLYTIPLSLGTPPQTIHLILSTATSFIWAPCGSKFKPYNLSHVAKDHEKIPTKYHPLTSTSWNFVKCSNPKCWWVLAKRPQTRCPTCKNPFKFHNGSHACPPYEFVYVDGTSSTKGTLLLETLTFTNYVLYDFVFGCSNFSNTLALGVIGLGRGLDSLPSQMGIKKFSYCLPSGSIDAGLERSKANESLIYTKFHKIPYFLPPKYRNYYYVTLEEIIVGNVIVEIPKSLRGPGSDGCGGTILDTGTTITILDRQIYNAVVREFEKQIGKDNYVVHVNDLGTCFKVSSLTGLPKLVFRFEDDANLVLSPWNYFALRSHERNIYNCLAVAAHINHDDPHVRRPAVVLGAFQQRDVYFEYDLEKERLGFRRQNCAENDEKVFKMSKY